MLGLLLLFGLSFSSCSINSNLYIDGGQQFVLGYNEHKSFNTKIENVGNTTVALAQRLPNGDEVDLGKLEAGQSISTQFSPNCAAILTNTDAEKQAKLQVKVTGDKGLNMEYERVNED